MARFSFALVAAVVSAASVAAMSPSSSTTPKPCKASSQTASAVYSGYSGAPKYSASAQAHSDSTVHSGSAGYSHAASSSGCSPSTVTVTASGGQTCSWSYDSLPTTVFVTTTAIETASSSAAQEPPPPPTTTTTIATNAYCRVCPTEAMYTPPQCQPVNGDFEIDMCSWAPAEEGASIGSTVLHDAAMTTWPWRGTWMWANTGNSTGIKTAVSMCETRGYCSTGIHMITMDESCGVNVCLYRDFDDAYGYICSGSQGFGGDHGLRPLGKDDSWRQFEFNIGPFPADHDPSGETWTWEIFTDCKELYADALIGGCQK